MTQRHLSQRRVSALLQLRQTLADRSLRTAVLSLRRLTIQILPAAAITSVVVAISPLRAISQIELLLRLFRAVLLVSEVTTPLQLTSVGVEISPLRAVSPLSLLLRVFRAAKELTIHIVLAAEQLLFLLAVQPPPIVRT